jgi:hypothetical protein
MAGTVTDFDAIHPKDHLASLISNKFMEWESRRSEWANQKKELRNYLFAVDTRTTSNNQLPWKNSTTMPKLTQIRDNLHANYMAALFPNSEWLSWEGESEEDETNEKRRVIEAYMRTKLRQDKAEVQVSKVLLDYIDYGNCFATAEWADDSIETDGEEPVRGYVGPRIVRISPLDIVFNPVGASFERTPKIIRSIKNLGELVKELQGFPEDSPEGTLLRTALDRSISCRQLVGSASQGDTFKADGFQMDGFSSIKEYYGTDYVEILTYYGDIYDINSNTLLENHVISIIDRRYVVEKRLNPNWTTSAGIFHAGWRTRPDNLYAMGPLDNLVGMQYRIDHLENLKADVFDLVALPILKIRGVTEDFEYAPNARIYVGDDGDVTFMNPPHEALNADSQIEELARRMEEMAGAPKEAMGIRSPGEKTKFEVQTLDNASSRIFMHKIRHFEVVFFEPLLNYMLQLARRNMSATDVTRTLDSDLDAVIFQTINKDDITANGVLRPRGASHFAQRANTLQNLTNILNSAVGQDPAVNVHLSGKKIAQLVEDLADLDKHKIYGENVRVIEQAETQQLMAQAGEQSEVAAATPPGIMEGDPSAPVNGMV